MSKHSGGATYSSCRTVLAWLVCAMVLALPGVAWGVVTGSVVLVGYEDTFRPGCWVSLTVSLRAESGDSGTYQVRVEQEDGDRDLISFVRTVTLTGTNSGSGVGQKFTTYFLPQGVNNGKSRGLSTTDLGTLKNQLRVYLCDARGNRLSKLEFGSKLTSLEEPSSGRHSRLVLCVKDKYGGDLRCGPDLKNDALLGVNEEISAISVDRSSLPASTLGYDMVDAVIWAAGRPPDVNLATEERQYRALRQWVSGGGKLVILQNEDWRLTEAWGDMLPVTYPKFGSVQGVRNRTDANLLTDLIATRKRFTPVEKSQWDRLRGPFPTGLVRAKEGAATEMEIGWDDTDLSPGGSGAKRSLMTPWLVRMGVGAGCVTYVAQDLTSPRLPVSSPSGWPIIWSRVLDLRYDPYVVAAKGEDEERAFFDKSDTKYNLGAIVYSRMNHSATAGVLVVVALGFFIVYWLAAGIVSWVVLVARRKREWAWLAFAGVACGATVVTLVVVRGVLRGPPELHHFTLVRVVQAGVGAEKGEGGTLVESRVGLYVKRDGRVRIEVPAGNPEGVSLVTPYAFHPREGDELDDSPPFQKYEVEVPDASGDRAPSIEMPFRSTMKRVQVSWRGDLKREGSGSSEAGEGLVGLSGSAAVAQAPNTLLSGTLLNASGRKLKNVVFAFRGNKDLTPGLDRVVFLPEWQDGAQLKLEDVTTIGRNGKLKLLLADTGKGDGSVYAPENGDSVYGLIGQVGRPAEWARWLRNPIRANVGGGENTLDDAGNAVPRGYMLLSLFDRLPFLANTDKSANAESYTRAEMLRVNARFVDISAAVSAGRLVVLAQSDNSPMPLPMAVDGDTIPGSGVTLYQFVLPLDRKYDLAAPEQ